MTEAVVREVDPERVIPFGSRARDEHNVNSDINLLIHDPDEQFALLDDRGQTAPERFWALADLTNYAVQSRCKVSLAEVGHHPAVVEATRPSLRQ